MMNASENLIGNGSQSSLLISLFLNCHPMGNGDADEVVQFIMQSEVPIVHTATIDSESSTGKCFAYICSGICLILWLVMGVVAVCAMIAANHTCASVTADNMNPCSLLYFLAGVSLTVFIGSFCVACVVCVYAVYADWNKRPSK